jgi:PAS domain S-box-containing protein
MQYLDQHFLPVLDAVDTAVAYHGTYEPGLVATSLGIAMLAAFVALSTSRQIIVARTQVARILWAAAGAISMGGGIWAMHFIGMLAFSLPCGVTYDPLSTALSMIPGVLASGVALSIICRRAEPGMRHLLGGAVLMASGIGMMHYAGMAAMQPQALMFYDPALVVVSVVVAIALAYISLGILFRFRVLASRALWPTFAAASVMGFAIAGMHYTAMRAAIFLPLPDPSILIIALPKTALAFAIVAVTGLIAASTLAATFAGRQTDLAQTLRAEIVRRQNIEHDAEGGKLRLQAILDSVVDGIVTIDQQGRIQQWSSGAERIFGYTSDEVLNRNVSMLMPEPHRLRDDRYIGSFLTTRDANIIGIGRELAAVRKDGTEFPMELAVNEVRIGDEVLFTGILRDISERKRTEAALILARQEAEDANAAKSQFLATMSHEIRTPMNGVIGMANLLGSTTLSERQRRLVTNLSRSGQSLLALINDILDFSKIEAGRFELFETDFDPQDVLADVTNVFCEHCTTRGLEFIYFIADDVPARLTGDPVRLRQVLINLVGNAIKFTERGEILLRLTVVQQGEGQAILSFSVEDTGIGIEPEKCGLVFESFRQVDNSMTRSRGGTGLGLTISKQLVELMGGQIGVESEVGRGSRFHFTIQCKVALAKAAEAPQIEKTLRVLLADANAVSARVMSLYLANWNVDATIVLGVDDANSAWSLAVERGHPFDAVIVDIKGLLDAGITLAQTLQKAAPVILLIGMDESIKEETLEAVGAAAMLTKPARPSELFDVLAAIASGEQGRDPANSPFATRRNAQTKRPQFDARILVAEDNPVNQDVVTGLLESLGCKVVTAPHGRSAIQHYAQEKFDLILMDCEMPILNGFQATKRIREMELMATADGDKPARMPILALTAHALADIRDECFAVGMDDFLVKPFDDEQIIAAFRRWIGPLERAGIERKIVVANGSKPIEDDAIEKIRAMDTKGNDALLKRVVSQFLSSAPPLVATIHAKSDAGDGDALWRAAHSLKSSAAALGAKQLAQHCADIETLAREVGVERVKGLLDTLDSKLTAATKRLQELVGVAA